MCLAVKYVVYDDSKGSAVVDDKAAIRNIDAINRIWSECNIGFQIDKYVAANPTQYKLAFNTANLSDLNSIRKTFQDSSTLLVVTTGSWNRSGTLGNTGANAWTNMPGEGVYGVVMESDVGTYSNIIAHELGHYLNLDHVNDESDLMNPIIYDGSTTLTQSQCNEARAAVSNYWTAMKR
jgi:hypothetical protein